MNIVIREDLKAYIDPLTPDETEALERSLLAEGCRDALVLWGDVLVDGHNRHALCQKHGLPFRTMQHPGLNSLEDVHLWMIDQHLGRRSVSDYQRGVLALRKREILAGRRERLLAEGAAAHRAAQADTGVATAAGDDGAPWDEVPGVPPPAALPDPDPLNTREALARAARLSAAQVAHIEKLQQQAAPELLAAVRAGEITLSAAAAVASLSAEEQAAAAQGGKAELKQAARKVREARRKPRAEEGTAVGTAGADEHEAALLDALRERVATLSAENDALRAQVVQLQAELAATRG